MKRVLRYQCNGANRKDEAERCLDAKTHEVRPPLSPTFIEYWKSSADTDTSSSTRVGHQLIPSEVLIEARSHASATGCGSYIAGALKCNPGCPPEPG